MADFKPIPGESRITYLAAAESFVMDPGAYADVALWGGGPGGKILDLVCLNEPIVQVADVSYVTIPLGDNLRRIRLTAKNIGQTVIEARLGKYGPPWARVGVAVGITPARSPFASGELKTALTAIESTAVNFAQRFIQDAQVRINYIHQAESAAREIAAKVQSGSITMKEGAQEAQQLRNGLLDAARVNNSDIGRAVSQAEKASGLTMEQLLTKYATQKFGKEFGKLAASEQDLVYFEIVRSLGRPNPRWNAIARNCGKAGKALLVVSIAFAVYNVATSDRPGREAPRQGANIGMGFLGSVAGGAAAGLVCGPGAPVCVGIGVLVGGIAFAVGSDIAFDWLWK